MSRTTRISKSRTLGLTWGLTLGLIAAGALLGAGCSSQIDRHGHQFTEADINQIRPGMTKEQIKTQLGTPDTTSTLSANTEAFYYISSTKKTVAFMKADEIDRKVLAVYFNPVGAVEKVANYGLKDGKVVNLVTRETPAHAAEAGMLKQLFRNLGYKQLFGE